MSTLKQLQERRRELAKQLNAFPLMVDTPVMFQRQKEVEAQLVEIEERIVQFSSHLVYVKKESSAA